MSDLLDQVHCIIEKVRGDEEKLYQILDYLESEIIDGECSNNPIDELTEKYKPIVYEIAQHIDMGKLCYLNPNTLEIDFIPQEMSYDIESFDSPEEIKKKLDDLHGWKTVKFWIGTKQLILNHFQHTSVLK